MDFAVILDHRLKVKEKENKYIHVHRQCQETKKARKHVDDGDTNCNRCTRNDSQILDNGTGGVGNQRTSRDDINYNIILRRVLET